MATAGCRFCLANDLLVDKPMLSGEHFFVLGSIDGDRPAQAMIVPHRHIETPFELAPFEWSKLGSMLLMVREHLAQFKPDGFTIGWNVGAAAGQEVFHAHLHVIGRFRGESSEGRGLHAALRARGALGE